MKLIISLLTVVVATGSLSAASAQEKHIGKADLPAAVQRTAQEQSQGATVKGYTLDHENGRTEYEVEMMTDGHSKDVSIAPDGQVLEVEEQVQMNALPATVQSALTASAGKGHIRKIESITKKGTLVAYEAQVYTAGKHSEIQVGPNGKKLAHEE